MFQCLAQTQVDPTKQDFISKDKTKRCSQGRPVQGLGSDVPYNVKTLQSSGGSDSGLQVQSLSLNFRPRKTLVMYGLCSSGGHILGELFTGTIIPVAGQNGFKVCQL